MRDSASSSGAEACPLHPWDLSPAEAAALQEELRRQVILEDRFGEIRSVGGVDVHYDEAMGRSRAAVAVLGFPGLETLETAVAERATTFIYVPGLLSFREIPPVLAALGKLSRLPDLLLCDGQGYAHPRRFGLACHLGVLTGLPSVGSAKTLFQGRHEEPPRERGSFSPLLSDEGETLGVALRTQTGVRPVYVSAGHLVSLSAAVELILALSPRFRVPEPLRQADHLARSI